MVKHAKTIAAVTQSGYMPPWKADTAYRKFVDQRVLSTAEINLIKNWVEHGEAEGDKKEAVEIPHFDNQSNLGAPNLILRMPEPYKLLGNNLDTVVFFKINYSIPSDTNVVAFEFSVGNLKAVHHVNTWVFPDTSEYARFYDKSPPAVMNDWEYDFSTCTWPPFYRQFDPAPPPTDLHYPEYFPAVPALYYDGWVPGTSPRKWPKGFGFRLPKKGFIIMQIHYAPSPIETVDKSQINIFYTAEKVDRYIESFNICSGGGVAEPEPQLILPPDSIKSFEITATVAKDLSYLYLNPHLHYLGKSMKAYAITPANDTIPLIWIKKWDFQWQEFYKPLTLIKIPKGSQIKVFATFDNTAANPENRFSPPREIHQGGNSTDEMMSLIILSVQYEKGDENIRLKSDQKY